MAALGASGRGLFSPKIEGQTAPICVEQMHGLWDAIHHVEGGAVPSPSDQVRELPAGHSTITALSQYENIVQQVPLRFYFPESAGSIQTRGRVVPRYNPLAVPTHSLRRPWHDTFWPPLGPAQLPPFSIGYGAEIGLQDGIQALWDPTNKCLFFLDHTHKAVIYRDPRPPPTAKPVVAKKQLLHGDRKRVKDTPEHACRLPEVIQLTAKRAHTKLHGFVLQANGKNGEHGAPGITGSEGCCGVSGYPGFTGGRGGNGTDGDKGSVGQRGKDATGASDVIVALSGNCSQLNVSGTCRFSAELGGERCEAVLFVNCRGGDGGKGGKGGNGGAGGRGGHGGDGDRGSPGYSSASGPGGDGGPGGNGGHGGNGGDGGPGGDGGGGGNAGHGGVCVIKTSDPTLLVLVEADCLDGTPGTGGAGGKGGEGGAGGVGGAGGAGGPGGSGGSSRDADGRVTYYGSGRSGSPGISGINGIRGANGVSGVKGGDGKPAPNGAILWVITSPTGEVLCDSATRYDAQVVKFETVSSIDDGIFEPNERIAVSKVTLINSGGLPLPAGAIASIPSTKTINFEPISFRLPRLQPGERFEIPVTFYGRIFDQPPPNAPGPFVSSAEFHPRIDLIGRPFEKSFLRKGMVVQYPIKLAHLRNPEHLGRGEIGIISVGLHNISSIAYGDFRGSGGLVTLRIHLDARLIPIGVANDAPCTVRHDPNAQDSMHITVHNIRPSETMEINIAVQMESRAELFDRCYWQADLILRDKLIEYNIEKFRVSPYYIPATPTADVLFVTNEHISRKEFVFWQSILETIGASVDFWDIPRYHGLSVDDRTGSPHPVTWKGRYHGKMILYPHCDLKLLSPMDIVDHFHNRQGQPYSAPLQDLQSSMVLFLPPSPPKKLSKTKFIDRGDRSIQFHLALASVPIQIQPNEYSGRHLVSPGSFRTSASPHHKWEKDRLKQIEKDVPGQSAVVLGRLNQLQKTGFISWKYGKVDIRRCPLLRSCKLTVVDGAGCSMTDMGRDDSQLTPYTTEIPLGSHYGQTLLVTLYGLPLMAKLRLLKTPTQESPDTRGQLKFYLPNSLCLSLPTLAAICMAHEIADEVLGSQGTCSRMAAVADDVRTSTNAYAQNGPIVLQLVDLLLKELKHRKKRTSNSRVSRSTAGIKRLCSRVRQTLRNARVLSRDLTPLPSLRVLLSSDRCHSPHQYIVEDEQWNLLGV